MKKYPKVSIIIPLYLKTPYFYESVGRCLELDYPDLEILICVDGKSVVPYQDKRIKILRTGERNTGPAEKRDRAIKTAKGEYIAFLDDDSYPDENWLKKSILVLKSKKVSAVCGPGLTPHWDSFSQKITGAILASKFGSGPYAYRFIKDTARFVDDYPAYNMIVEKKVLTKIGGFGTKFYGGEDTALCIKLIKAGEKIYYHPDIVVYHHRRHFPAEYIRQVGNVGRHRGYFVKAYPQTSLRISYFLPSIVTVLTPLVLILTFLNPQILFILLPLSVVAYLIIFFESFNKNDNIVVNLLLPLALAINHLAYGVNFINGLIFTSELKR